jgi:hypothetical protein
LLPELTQSHDSHTAIVAQVLPGVLMPVRAPVHVACTRYGISGVHLTGQAGLW